MIGLIYRNSPYVTQSSNAVCSHICSYAILIMVVILQLDILVNLLGFSLPIPTCFTENISPVYVALLGLVPPLLVTLVTVLYVLRYASSIGIVYIFTQTE